MYSVGGFLLHNYGSSAPSPSHPHLPNRPLCYPPRPSQGLALAFKPAALYRGLPMACINLGGSTGVQFLATGLAQKVGACRMGWSVGESVCMGGALEGGPLGYVGTVLHSSLVW